MIEDTRRVPGGTHVETDICIVGAGAAGITLALQMINTSRSVVIVESGGDAADAATQELYDGTVVSNFLADRMYLTESRVRQFGGSTNSWAGVCVPLSPIDFVAREGVPNSGWPFDRAHLDPYYRRALPLVEVSPFDQDPARLSRQPVRLPPHAGIDSLTKHLGPPANFRVRHRRRLESAPNVRVLLNGNVLALRTDDGRRRVGCAQIASLNGPRFSVHAKQFVLAAGGIENARLLLASNNLGNDHDLVGRYFIDHVYDMTELGRLVLAVPRSCFRLYEGVGQDLSLGHPTFGRLVLSDRLQLEHALPNHGISLRGLCRQTPAAGNGRPTTSRESHTAASTDDYIGTFGIDLEMVPDPSNRVRLGDQTDALGNRRPVLEWSLTPYDKESAIRYLSLFAARLEAAHVGRAKVSLTLDYDWSRFVSSAHHIGTTRMHVDPRRGVVDANSRVHGVDNLHIAGSSVFPTAGQANPTFTIVALALRLADHLKSLS